MKNMILKCKIFENIHEKTPWRLFKNIKIIYIKTKTLIYFLEGINLFSKKLTVIHENQLLLIILYL